MPYPSKNNSTYTAPTKNSSTSSNSEQSGQNFLMIDSTYSLLIDSVNKLLIEPLSQDWSYNQKS
jgi:hypothetical protein